MDVDADALAAEIRKLCGRQGARHRSLGKRLGPQLKNVCGITELDQAGQMRPKLESTSKRLTSDQPQLQETLLAALGLHPRADQSSLGGRLRWVASKQHLSPRTADRRLDDAIALFVLAAVATAHASAAADLGYVVDNFDGSLKIEDRATFVQRRKITATCDNLRAIDIWLDDPFPPTGERGPGLRVELVFGGVRGQTYRRPGKVRYSVELAQPLRTGEAHEFEVSYVVPLDLLQPYYLVQPVAPFRTISLRVRFDPCRLPVLVRRINGTMPWDTDGGPSDGELLVPNPSADVDTTFTMTREGRCFGVSWVWE